MKTSKEQPVKEANSRREFIKTTALAAGSLPLLGMTELQPLEAPLAYAPLEIHIFSKHLQFLDPGEAGRIAASLGFAGVDLTVRPGGHVAPESVSVQLPKALEAIRNAGSRCDIITTAVETKSNPIDVQLLKTAAANGIRWYRTNWFRYPDSISMPESLEKYRRQVAALARINRKLGLVGCYQNHAGTLVGSSLWEIDKILETADPVSFGLQYDIRHATVEGGLSWRNGLRLVRDHIRTLVLKDFKWVHKNGSWQVLNTPIGEGMVDFPAFFTYLKKEGIRVPAILHLEYPLGGAEHGHSNLTIAKEIVFEAMRKDLATIQKLWEEA